MTGSHTTSLFLDGSQLPGLMQATRYVDVWMTRILELKRERTLRSPNVPGTEVCPHGKVRDDVLQTLSILFQIRAGQINMFAG